MVIFFYISHFKIDKENTTATIRQTSLPPLCSTASLDKIDNITFYSRCKDINSKVCLKGGVKLNCPRCKKGVLEQAAFIEADKDLVLKVEKLWDEKPNSIQIYICSYDPCGHIETRVNGTATPGTLSTAKKIMRNNIRSKSSEVLPI